MNAASPAIALGLVAIAAASPAQTTQTTQTTIVRAPIAALAFGPSQASVDVNVNDGKRSHTVVVMKPLVAVSPPFWSMHIRVN